MNEKELATILAALGFWKDISNETPQDIIDNKETWQEIYGEDPMSAHEIDGLCERLNIEHNIDSMISTILKMTEDIRKDQLSKAIEYQRRTKCCRDHDIQANDGLDNCLCCGDDIG